MILSKEIIKEWRLDSLPEEKKEATVSRIGRILYQAILVRTLDILSDIDQDELDELMNQNTTTPKDVLLFLKKKIPTFDELLREERDNLRGMIIF
ncbi:MAG: hypothetical protein WAW92_01465 [Minisyncoccia bacterium]